MGMLKGRLGLDTARIPHSDRHGLIWLSRGTLHVEDGCLKFVTGGFDGFPAGSYGLSHQMLSAVLLGPGSSVTHDALRLLGNHRVCLMAVGEGGCRIYTAPPLRPDTSQLARRQVQLWSDGDMRLRVARRMYAWRFGEVLPHRDLDVLRGIEGHRVRRLYAVLAERHGVPWNGRVYDRENPLSADEINQAINHAATAMYAAAAIAVYSVGALPHLGFIHEASGDSFCLDIADLFRMEETVPAAFEAVKDVGALPLERLVRRKIGRRLRDGKVIDRMIGRIKELLDVDDGGRD